MDKRGENAGARSLGAFEVKNGGRSTGQEREITELGSIEINMGGKGNKSGEFMSTVYPS